MPHLAARSGRLLLHSALVGALGCGPPPTFSCDDNRACVLADGTQGLCEPDHTCSFPDVTCAGSRRRSGFGALATDCVAPGPRCVVGLAAGADHACALRSDGRVLCWGSNLEGQAGALLERSVVTEPALVEGLPSAATAVSLGRAHSCAILDDRRVFCWGLNGKARVGVEEAGASFVPRPVPGALGHHFEATTLAVGGAHACAIGPTGAASCWGHNRLGQCGQDPTPDGGLPEVPRALEVVASPLRSTRAMGSGADFSCGLGDDRRAYCFGSNRDGALGAQQVPTPSFSPSRVGELDELSELAVGERHACAIDGAGSLWCWGYGGVGSLGLGSLLDAPSPARVGVAARVVAGSTSAVTCTLDLPGLAMECWGRNDTGQTGTGLVTPLVTSPVRALLTTVDQLALGGSFGCASTTDGALWCWGRNDQGQLGLGETGGRVYAPRRVGFPCAP